MTALKRWWIFVVLALVILTPVLVSLANDFYTHGSFPESRSRITSSSIRAEFDLISNGFSCLPSLVGHANQAIVIGNGGTCLTSTTGTLALAGNTATSGAYPITLNATGTTTLTLPTTGTIGSVTGAEAWTNKTLDLSSNTVTGTTAQWNTALSDNDFLTQAGSESVTNKTVTAPVLSGTATGTYTIGGTPTVASPAISGTVTGTYTIGGTPSISNATLNSDLTLASNITAAGIALGNNTAGPSLGIGRNTNGGAEGPAAGALQLTQANGTNRFYWVDANGQLRVHTSAPTGSSGSPTISDTAGTALGTTCETGFTQVQPHVCLTDGEGYQLTYWTINLKNVVACTNQDLDQAVDPRVGGPIGQLPISSGVVLLLMRAEVSGLGSVAARTNTVTFWPTNTCSTTQTDSWSATAYEYAASSSQILFQDYAIVKAYYDAANSTFYTTMANAGTNGVNYYAVLYGYFN